MFSKAKRSWCRRLSGLVAMISSLSIFMSAVQPAQAKTSPDETYDVIVYGGTAAAVAAAIEAGHMGVRVLLLSPDKHLGGMTSSGLGWTDSKDGDALGGLTREFYHRVWQYYRRPEAWTRSKREEYAARVHAQPGKTIDDEKEVMWTFEPHVAEKIFDEWLAGTRVVVKRDAWLDRKNGVTVKDHRIVQIGTLSGETYAARAFIDATYEGDLMAAAGVSYRVGRDSAQEYGESLNGIFFKKLDDPRQEESLQKIDPYVVKGDPKSGFVAGIDGEMPAGEKIGDADTRLQSFNYRLCLTTIAENRVPVGKPKNYNEARYEFLYRLYEVGQPSGFSAEEMPNGKTDSNNSGRMSLDFIGGNYSIAGGWNYSESDYEHRKQIIRNHVDYTRGLLWTLMNSPRIPEKDRMKWSQYGLAADEFADNGNWPYQLYVREARRMLGRTMMTQHHIELKPGYEIADSIGLGSYSLDSHGVRRVVIDGKIRFDGGFYIFRKQPYPISYGAIVPREAEIRNLLVPVTLSATHAAFGSIRMEPTYMILGQSAGAAAALSVIGKTSVQEVPYETLKARLLAAGQRLAPSPPAPEAAK